MGHHVLQSHIWGYTVSLSHEKVTSIIQLNQQDYYVVVSHGLLKYIRHLYYWLLLSKLDSCLCENKGATLFSPHGYCNSSSTCIQNFKLLACFCTCIAQFVSDLFGNPEDWVSRDAAHFLFILFLILSF